MNPRDAIDVFYGPPDWAVLFMRSLVTNIRMRELNKDFCLIFLEVFKENKFENKTKCMSILCRSLLFWAQFYIYVQIFLLIFIF